MFLAALLLLASSASAATVIKVTTKADPDNGMGQCSAGGAVLLREVSNADKGHPLACRVNVANAAGSILATSRAVSVT